MSANQYITSSITKTWIMIFLFIALVTTLAYIFGKTTGYGLPIPLAAIIISALFVLVCYYFSGDIILFIMGAKKIKENEQPLLLSLINNLCDQAKLPKPKLLLINSDAINAFATGRDPKHGAICFTTGLLKKLNNPELEGVIAYELSLIKNYDTLPTSIVVILIGLPAFLSDLFIKHLLLIPFGAVLSLFSPLVAAIMQVIVSQKRVLTADSEAVLLSRYPEGLASALEKIKEDKEILKTANNATVHLFIQNPYVVHNAHFFSGLFNTHPSIDKRINILRSL